MNATKRAQVPFGLRKKLMAATSMLLVAAIMLVSTSYAWFTLSTAPEITGISTSVGANGNLEIALLDTETAKIVFKNEDIDIFTNPNDIVSGTSDSIEASGQTAKKANVTWGNLISLAGEYGLEGLVLYPSALNVDSDDAGTFTIADTAPLATPTYGVDGRVKALEDNTMSTIQKNGAFTVSTTDDPAYGVRAVGVADNVSPRQLAFSAAQSRATDGGEEKAAQSKISGNAFNLLTLAVAGADADYTYKQVNSMKEIALGVQSSLKNIVKTYANAIATVVLSAESGLEDDKATIAAEAISDLSDAQTLLDAVTAQGVNNVSSINTLTGGLGDLVTAQSNAQAAVTAVEGILTKYGTADVTDPADKTIIKEQVAQVLIGNSDDIEAYQADGSDATLSMEDALGGKISEVYLIGGEVATVAEYTGKFKAITLSEMGNVEVWAGQKNAETGTLDDIVALVEKDSENVTAPGGAATSTLSEFYGFIVDFAFRTNATNSKLLLQTDAINRVYSNDPDLKNDATKATMGSGSTASFVYEVGSGVTADMGEKLLHAMRVVFFDPGTREVYGFGMFDEADITADGNQATGALTIFTRKDTTTTKWDLGKDAYDETTVTTHVLKDKMGEYETSETYFNNFAAVKTSYTEEEWTTATTVGNALEETATQAPTVEDGTGAIIKGVLGQDAYTTVTETVYVIKPDHKVGENENPSDANCWDFEKVKELTKAEYDALTATGDVSRDDTVTEYVETTGEDAGVLMDLPQNEAVRMSALVYLDGEGIDNSAVGIAQKSGELKLNLQFASNANLQPMENNALKNQTKE